MRAQGSRSPLAEILSARARKTTCELVKVAGSVEIRPTGSGHGKQRIRRLFEMNTVRQGTQPRCLVHVPILTVVGCYAEMRSAGCLVDV